jgi:hypothetical protein
MWAALLAAASLYCSPDPGADPVAVVANVRAAFNAHDIAAMRRFYAPDARVRSILSTGVVERSIDETLPRIQRDIFDLGPNVRGELIDTWVVGNRVIIQERFTGDPSLENIYVTAFTVEDGCIIVVDGFGR